MKFFCKYRIKGEKKDVINSVIGDDVYGGPYTGRS